VAGISSSNDVNATRCFPRDSSDLLRGLVDSNTLASSMGNDESSTNAGERQCKSMHIETNVDYPFGNMDI